MATPFCPVRIGQEAAPATEEAKPAAEEAKPAKEEAKPEKAPAAKADKPAASARPKGGRSDRKGEEKKEEGPSIDEFEYIDYKNTELLLRYLNEQGKILPRRITNISAKQQRQLTRAIKRARHLALLPFVSDMVR